jgi:tetratricopeptide (TPR) repeat protein
MDVDNFLNIERRTGIKNKDIDAFMSKVDNVQDQLAKLMSGELAPEDVKVPGELTAEELAIKAKDKARRARERAEEAAAAKKEEHERWWRGARMRKEHLEYLRENAGKVTVEVEGEVFPKPKRKGKDCLDYSVWEKWIPDDPVSLAEMKEKVDAEDAKKNALFEANNPEFCNNFKEDQEKREKSKLRKETDAERARQKGNKYFKRKDFKSALKMYLEALELMPHVVAILTNIVQAHIKLDDLEMAREFCDRALFLDEGNVKAFSRRALCSRKVGDYAAAVKDLKSALEVEPHNKSLVKEFKKTTTAWDEAKAEARVAQMAAGGAKKGSEKGKATAPTTTAAAEAANAPQAISAKDDTPPAAPAPAPAAGPAEAVVAATDIPAVKTLGKDAPTEFMLLSRAQEVWTEYLGLTKGEREDRASANLAAQAMVPLLLRSDDCRIFIRRSGLVKAMSQFLVDAYPKLTATADMDGTATNESEKVDAAPEAKSEPADANAQAVAAAAAVAKSARPAELATVMDVMAAACRNRLVQEEFVQLGGLDAVANALAASLAVPESRRSASADPSKMPEKATILSITVIRAAVELIEVCTSHELSCDKMLAAVTFAAKQNTMNKKTSKRKKAKKKTCGAKPQAPAQNTLLLLLETIYSVQENVRAVRFASDAFCVLSQHASGDRMLPFMLEVGSSGLNPVAVAATVLTHTHTLATSSSSSSADSNHAMAECRESLSRFLAALSIHPQWRAFFCAFDAIPALIGVLRPNTVDSVAARANALAALMNSSVASDDTASEVYTEIRDQIHRGGAVAWLVHLCGSALGEETTKVGKKAKTDVVDAEAGKDRAGTSASIASTSTTTTAAQEAALRRQRRLNKSMLDHVRERAAGLLSRCAVHPPILETLSHPSLYSRVAVAFVSAWRDSMRADADDLPLLANLVRIVASCTSATRPQTLKLMRDSGADLAMVALLRYVALDLKLKPSDPRHQPSVQIAGNACKCMIACVANPTSAQANMLVSKGKLIGTVIDVIRSTNEASTRKNAAITLARLAKDPGHMVKIRELRGMEILMSLGRSIV